MTWLPLVDEGELAVHGVACDKLSGCDSNLPIGLGVEPGVDPADCHQAAEVGAVLVGLPLPLHPQLAGGPAPHVSCAVDRAVPLRLCRGQSSGTPLTRISIQITHPRSVNYLPGAYYNNYRLDHHVPFQFFVA